MESDKSLKARDFLEELAAKGRYSFTSRDAQAALGVSSNAALLALSRLAKQGAVVSPAKGFYVRVPPEYRSLGCLPPDQFIPDLMESLKLRYYVSLLSAAQYHGAAHQRPQVFQVFLEDKRRPIVCGRVHVTFMVRKKLRDVAVQKLNTPRGFLLVSTPEATALDLVGYAHQSGGLNNVATVLSELAEKIDGEQLAKAAAAAPIVWAQRLGYLLEQVGSAGKAAALKAHVRARARKATPLKPGAPHEKAKQDRAWKLSINTDVETDL